jgi:hypothetical protein
MKDALDGLKAGYYGIVNWARKEILKKQLFYTLKEGIT